MVLPVLRIFQPVYPDGLKPAHYASLEAYWWAYPYLGLLASVLLVVAWVRMQRRKRLAFLEME
jgi:hypothetical protein